MKKLIATAFCAALTLPTMQAFAAQTGQNDVSPTGDGQEYMGSKATDSDHISHSEQGSHMSGDAAHSSIEEGTNNDMTGRQGHSAAMQDEGTALDNGDVQQQPETQTGRQGHSAEMQTQEGMGNDTAQ
ncbi:hypothetical protein [Larsenimonas suaedae]|uniref:Pentapeptide MXKDX repeat protein n=1 Tax=Larsenimonas suaedae TaxID=1851019 RepID=A0ABU1GWG3_9GAMM|nr:hypothetical protein [Larsenimonas suaedae]MCM2972952.1 hypothetical protein [Larsenimonas suaedae]MDR5896389.1 hypothetical protein [Larsenimonas suaedae]